MATIHQKRLINPPLIPFPPPLLLVVFSVFLHLIIIVSATHKTTNRATTYPHYQHINIRKAIASTKLHSAHLNSNSDSHSQLDKHQLILNHSHSITHNLNLNLIHRDKLPSVFPSAHLLNHRHRFLHRIQRDINHVSALLRRLSLPNSTFSSNKVEAFGSNVVSGMEQGSGEYFVRIGVGSPARNQYLVMDSGSDVVWVQCQPCDLCYRQSDPVFNPSDSATFSTVSCSSAACSRLPNSACHSGNCRYEVDYTDGSYTKGNLAFETLTLGGTTIRNVAIGCGHTNRGMFVGAAGLLGLGAGSMSFLGQLGGQTGGAFSYCLVSRGSGSTGSLVFGREAIPVGAAWINLVRNTRAPSFYYVGLTGLGVGGVRVSLPDGIFGLTESGDGGVVLDTGTAVTRLPTEAYVAFRDAFVTETGSLPRAAAVSIFDTCYDLAGFMSVRVPTVSFYFEDGPILTLPARNFLIPVDEKGTFCFAFAGSPTGLGIIGNIQQEGIQISIDGANGFVGFGPNVC